MTTKFFFILSLTVTGCSRHYNTHRSPLRKTTHRVPTIKVSDDNGGMYMRTSSAYKKYPLFTVFDHTFFMNHQIPNTGIQYTHTDEVVSYETFNTVLENTVNAIMRHEKTIPGCTIIRDANFNYQTGCGLLILKINSHPFVIKLFRETPESFINPYGKGLEQISFFFMAGGVNRHVAGLTRIPNREYVYDLLQKSPYWYDKIQIPRKWHWIPKKPAWLTIDGYNIEGIANIKTSIPALYAIIADYVDPEETYFFDAQQKKKLLMNLCLFCGTHLDPNMPNFIIKQDNAHAEPIVTVVDTEDPQCITGIAKPIPYSNYFEWYTLLAKQFLKSILFNIKQA